MAPSATSHVLDGVETHERGREVRGKERTMWQEIREHTVWQEVREHTAWQEGRKCTLWQEIREVREHTVWQEVRECTVWQEVRERTVWQEVRASRRACLVPYVTTHCGKNNSLLSTGMNPFWERCFQWPNYLPLPSLSWTHHLLCGHTGKLLHHVVEKGALKKSNISDLLPTTTNQSTCNWTKYSNLALSLASSGNCKMYVFRCIVYLIKWIFKWSI